MLRQPGQPALHTTKAFSAWFGQSQVTDADGNPQVVYHGSPARKGHPAFGTHGNHTPVITAGRPFFVTDDLAYAEKFARGGHVQALYVRLINPVDLSDPAQCERLVKVFNADPAVLLTRGPWDEDFEGDIADSAYFLLESAAVMQLLKDEGFDGARVPEDIELGVESFAVFAPGQLKAAAMLQARPKHGKDTGCLVINVNPQDIEFSTGTGEFYAPEGLSLSEDGCWISSRSKDEAQSDESLPAPAP